MHCVWPAQRAVLAERRQQLGGKLDSLRGGLAKLAEARAAVDGLAAACEAQQAAVRACKAACEALLVRIVQHKRGADERQRRVHARMKCITSLHVIYPCHGEAWLSSLWLHAEGVPPTCPCRYKQTRRGWPGRLQMPRHLLRNAKQAWTAHFLHWQRLSRRCVFSQVLTWQS